MAPCIYLHAILVKTSSRRPRPPRSFAFLRYKILTEAHAFPSDTYAVKSQLLLHGIDPANGLVEVAPRPGEWNFRFFLS